MIQTFSAASCNDLSTASPIQCLSLQLKGLALKKKLKKRWKALQLLVFTQNKRHRDNKAGLRNHRVTENDGMQTSEFDFSLTLNGNMLYI